MAGRAEPLSRSTFDKVMASFEVKGGRGCRVDGTGWAPVPPPAHQELFDLLVALEKAGSWPHEARWHRICCLVQPTGAGRAIAMYRNLRRQTLAGLGALVRAALGHGPPRRRLLPFGLP